MRREGTVYKGENKNNHISREGTMKKRFPLLIFIIVALGTFIYGLGSAPQALAVITFMNGDMRVDGFYKEYIYTRLHIPGKQQRFHSTNVDEMLSSFLVNVLYKVKEDECQSIHLFTAIKYWYEKASVWDSKLNSAIPPHEKTQYQHPVNEEDIIAEAYLDYIRGPFNLKIGKQIVVWGETDIQRTVDIVNPLDLRYGSPGVFSWSELKKGLWMFRGFYQSQLPGGLLFEGIYNPGYYQGITLTTEGTHWGPSPVKPNGFNPGHGSGIYNWSVTEGFKRWAPKKWAMSNWELGFRVRGFTWNIDWTLVYYNSLADAPVAVPKAIGNYGVAYVSEGFRSLDTGETINPKYDGPPAYSYRRYQLFGGTMQTIIDKLHGSVWRCEYFYEHNLSYNEGTKASSSAITDIVKRDTVGLGLNYADKFNIPYITKHWFSNQYFQVSLTGFYEKILNYNKDLIVDTSRSHRVGASHATLISWNLMQQWNNVIWTFVFTGSWNPEIKKGFIAPMIAYGPGNHWRFEGGPVFYCSSYKPNLGYYDKDSILIRIRYEF